jgi:hypothetical protein
MLSNTWRWVRNAWAHNWLRFAAISVALKAKEIIDWIEAAEFVKSPPDWVSKPITWLFTDGLGVTLLQIAGVVLFIWNDARLRRQSEEKYITGDKLKEHITPIIQKELGPVRDSLHKLATLQLITVLEPEFERRVEKYNAAWNSLETYVNSPSLETTSKHLWRSHCALVNRTEEQLEDIAVNQFGSNWNRGEPPGYRPLDYDNIKNEQTRLEYRHLVGCHQTQAAMIGQFRGELAQQRRTTLLKAKEAARSG